MQHSGASGSLPDRQTPVIWTGFLPPPPPLSLAQLNKRSFMIHPVFGEVGRRVCKERISATFLN